MYCWPVFAIAMKKRSCYIGYTVNLVIIQTKNKDSAVNQLEDLLVTWNGFQQMAHARPSVTVFWRESGDWEVGGRGGVVGDILQILINRSCGDYVTWNVNKTKNCLVISSKGRLDGTQYPKTNLRRRKAHDNGLVLWRRKLKNENNTMINITMGTFFTTKTILYKGWTRIQTVPIQISP